jgi:biotin carboxyl carrier protein
VAVAALSPRSGHSRSTLQDGTILRPTAPPRAQALVWTSRRLPWRDGWPKRFARHSGRPSGMAVVNVKSEIAGNVWKIQLKPGDKVEVEGEIMILESMKMEIPVLSPKAGTIKEIKVNEGEAIGEGQLVAVIDA